MSNLNCRKKLAALLMGLMVGLFTAKAYPAQLTLWEHEKEEEQKVLDELINRFEKQNPGIKVKRSHYKTEDLRTQFQTAAMGGGGADLVIAPNDFAGPFSIMGVIKPVNQFGAIDRFYTDLMQTVTDEQNRAWGLPISRGNHLMLFLNKSMIKKTPQTVEEMIELAKQATNLKENKYGLVYHLNEPFWFVTFLGAFGEMPLTKRQPQLNTPGMIKALSLVYDIKFKDKIVPSDCDYTCADTLFSEGKAGMIINGDWAVNKYLKLFKDQLVITGLPKLEATGKYMTPMISGKFIFFNKNLRHKRFEEAQKFSEFLLSKKTQEYLIKESGKLPALKALGDSELIKKDPTLLASLKAMDHGVPMPMAVEMRVVWDAIRPQLQRVMSGKAEAKLAAAVMQKDAETKIKEMSQ